MAPSQPVDKPLLNILQQLPDGIFERLQMSGAVSEMVAQNFAPQDGGQLTQGLEVLEVDDQGS